MESLTIFKNENVKLYMILSWAEGCLTDRLNLMIWKLVNEALESTKDLVELLKDLFSEVAILGSVIL